MKTEKRFVLWLVIVVVSIICVNVNAAGIVTPVDAVASTEFAEAVAGNVIDSSRLNSSNELMPGGWSSNWLFDCTTPPDNWTSYQWLYVDLGQEYTLDEIRIWNYFDEAEGVQGRGLKDFGLFLGAEGAFLPSSAGPGPFNLAGWTYVLGGQDMTIAPQAVEPIGPTDVYTQFSGMVVRYIGIDVELATWNGVQGGDIGGLSYIQVTSDDVVPEPATVVLLSLGGIAVLRRRRHA